MFRFHHSYPTRRANDANYYRTYIGETIYNDLSRPQAKLWNSLPVYLRLTASLNLSKQAKI